MNIFAGWLFCCVRWMQSSDFLTSWELARLTVGRNSFFLVPSCFPPCFQGFSVAFSLYIIVFIFIRFFPFRCKLPFGHFLCSRIPPVENGPFRLDFFQLDSSGPCSYRQSSSFYSFCALPRGGWCERVLLYSRRNRLAALWFWLSPRATGRRTFAPVSWWLWA